MREVFSSAVETELEGSFYNGKDICPMQIALEEMGHKQLITLIVIDNSTIVGITNKEIKQKRSKAIDTTFYWI